MILLTLIWVSESQILIELNAECSSGAHGHGWRSPSCPRAISVTLQWEKLALCLAERLCIIAGQITPPLETRAEMRVVAEDHQKPANTLFYYWHDYLTYILITLRLQERFINDETIKKSEEVRLLKILGAWLAGRQLIVTNRWLSGHQKTNSFHYKCIRILNILHESCNWRSIVINKRIHRCLLIYTELNRTHFYAK